MSVYVPPELRIIDIFGFIFSVGENWDEQKPQNNMGNACLKEIMLLIDVEVWVKTILL